MENRSPLVMLCFRSVLLLLLLLVQPHGHQGQTLRHLLPTQSQDPPAVCLSNGPGQEPITIMTFDLTKIQKASSSFEIRTWDSEGVIFYGDTNPKDDWFMLGLRDGRPEIQLHNQWAQLTVGAGCRLDDGRWHQMGVRIHGDSVLLEVDGELVLSLRQVSGPMSNKPQPIMRIALGGLLFPVSDLLLPELVQNSVSKIFPSLRQSPGPSHWTWDSSWQQVQATSLSWALQKTLLGSVSTSKIKYSVDPKSCGGKVVLSTRTGAGPRLDLPLVLGVPLQLKLHESRVVLSQGPKKEILTLLPWDDGSLLNLWAQPQGHLFLGTLPGEASSASFCLDGLWAQGQKLDIDQALNRSQDIWTHSCPHSLSNDTDTTH
ncbi:sex hormone-binding globulin isoform X2 [Talpa occidentalis]|uniref:sex hormone-binding globulin isoform X2 n=1 Tax=Talpa occidentalis TaxID=50954 RepID=UPI00188DC8E2|nr:sex hormone-binding globulin isoform X2 [Talpa occidentalis]